MFDFLKKFFSFLAVAMVTFAAEAQSLGLSPYSKTYLGDINRETSMRDADMGNVGVANYSPMSLSTANPAFLHNNVYALIPGRYAYFDFNVSAKFTGFKSNQGTDGSTGGSLNRIAIMLPVNKNRATKMKWGSTVVLKPYATMNYDISGTNTTIGDTLNYSYSNTGKGGLTQILWGNGVKLNKNFSIGLNTSYIFGKYTESQSTKLENSGYTYSFTNDRRMSYLLLQPGFAYSTNIRKFDTVKVLVKYTDSTTLEEKSKWVKVYKKTATENFLHFGATYETGLALKSSSFNTKQATDPNLYATPMDTLLISDMTKYNLPGEFKIGASVVNLTDMALPNWAISFETGYRQWSLYNPTLGLRNTLSSGFGLEKKAVVGKNRREKLMYFRTGAYYNQLPTLFKGSNIDEMGLTLGTTYRLSGVKGLRDIMYLNASVGVGQRGTTNNNLIQEKFIKVTLGFTFLEDRWFWKYKVD
jgi:hypothetical protein